MSSDPLMLSNLEKVTGAELKQLQKRCMLLMQQDDEPQKFPGSQPVSFERKHLRASEEGRGNYVSLLASPYFAAEKTDGVRYMLLILGGKGAFTVDRNFDMRRLPPMRFPTRLDPNAALDATLLDGELIIERGGSGQPLENLTGKKRGADDGGGSSAADGGGEGGSGGGSGEGGEGASGESGEGGSAATRPDERLRFLAYDACRVAGKAVCDEPLRMRLMALRREVLTPRFKLAMTSPEAFAGEPFTLEQKDFFVLPQVERNSPCRLLSPLSLLLSPLSLLLPLLPLAGCRCCHSAETAAAPEAAAATAADEPCVCLPTPPRLPLTSCAHLCPHRFPLALPRARPLSSFALAPASCRPSRFLPPLAAASHLLARPNGRARRQHPLRLRRPAAKALAWQRRHHFHPGD